MPSQTITGSIRLRKHADYQQVYANSRKQFSKQMTYFFVVRPPSGPDGCPRRGVDTSSPRVGLTVGKVMGKAVDRNRIKRRLRELIRRNGHLLHGSVDVILHPRRSTIDIEFAALDREVRSVFQSIQRQVNRAGAATQGQPKQRGQMNRNETPPALPSSTSHL